MVRLQFDLMRKVVLVLVDKIIMKGKRFKRAVQVLFIILVHFDTKFGTNIMALQLFNVRNIRENLQIKFAGFNVFAIYKFDTRWKSVILIFFF